MGGERGRKPQTAEATLFLAVLQEGLWALVGLVAKALSALKQNNPSITQREPPLQVQRFLLTCIPIEAAPV